MTSGHAIPLSCRQRLRSSGHDGFPLFVGQCAQKRTQHVSRRHFELNILAAGVRRLTDSEYPALDAGDALLKEAQDKNMGGSLSIITPAALYFCCCMHIFRLHAHSGVLAACG